jgi:hypothetical protein
MIWPAIFANFRRTKWLLSWNPMLLPFFPDQRVYWV